MYGKIKITADLTVLTGMHIGGSSIFSAIGSVDSPVMRDAITQLPIIPGSSLKGKMRTLLARTIEQKIILPKPDDDQNEIKRLFGTSSKPIQKSRLQFADAFLSNKEKFTDIAVTEVKFENTISRTTAVANPRQIERVVRGSVFEFVLIYDIDEEGEIEADFKNMANALNLLQMDYLGGHGTRGYGKVKFTNFTVECVAGEIENKTTDKLTAVLKEVEKFALLSIQA